MNKYESYNDEIEFLVLKGWRLINQDKELIRRLNILYIRAEKSSTPPCCEEVQVNFLNRIESYYSTINPNYQKQEPMSAKGEFQFKKGMKHYVPSINGHITAENLTDQLAVESLAENPARINAFERFPDDWKERVKEFKNPSKKAKEKQPDLSAKEKKEAKEKADAEAIAAAAGKSKEDPNEKKDTTGF